MLNSCICSNFVQDLWSLNPLRKFHYSTSKCYYYIRQILFHNFLYNFAIIIFRFYSLAVACASFRDSHIFTLGGWYVDAEFEFIAEAMIFIVGRLGFGYYGKIKARPPIYSILFRIMPFIYDGPNFVFRFLAGKIRLISICEQ